MSIKTELRAYYAKQGLTGEHLRKALRYDMRAVRKGPQLMHDGIYLHSRLHWGQSDQGDRYWLNRSIGNGR